jgi:hypothetical protein
MWMTMRRVFGAVLLAVCVGAPIAEMFDRWDQTAEDGNDTETSLVVVAVCVGIGFVAAATMLRRVRPAADAHFVVRPFTQFVRVTDPHAIAPTPSSSPPSALRI